MKEFRRNIYERIMCLVLAVVMSFGVFTGAMPMPETQEGTAQTELNEGEVPPAEAETAPDDSINTESPAATTEPEQAPESPAAPAEPEQTPESTPESETAENAPAAEKAESGETAESTAPENGENGNPAEKVTEIKNVLLPEVPQIRSGTAVSAFEYLPEFPEMEMESKWLEGEREMLPDELFAENVSYTLMLTFAPKAGFAFSAIPSVFAETGGMDENGVEIRDEIPAEQKALSGENELVVTLLNIVCENAETPAPDTQNPEAAPDETQAPEVNPDESPAPEAQTDESPAPETSPAPEVPAETPAQETAAVKIYDWEWVDTWGCLNTDENGVYAEILHVNPENPAAPENIISYCLPKSILAFTETESAAGETVIDPAAETVPDPAPDSANDNSAAGENPEGAELNTTAEKTEIIINGWESADFLPDANGNYPQSGVYTFNALLPESYILKEGSEPLSLRVQLPSGEVQVLPDREAYGIIGGVTGILGGLVGGLVSGIGGLVVGTGGLIGDIAGTLVPEPGYSSHGNKDFDLNFYAFINNKRTLMCHNGLYYTYKFGKGEPNYIYNLDLAALYQILGVTDGQLSDGSTFFPYTARDKNPYSKAAVTKIKSIGGTYLYSPHTAAGAASNTPTDIYYIPQGVSADGNNINSLNTVENNFYSVSVYGGGYDELHFVKGADGKVLDTTDGTITLPNTDPDGLPLTWLCIAEDGSEIKGKVTGENTVFTFNGINKYYNIRPLQNSETDINFYAYVDGERRLVAKSSQTEGFRSYCWNWKNQPSYINTEDIKSIYQNFIAGSSDKEFINHQPENFSYAGRKINEDGTETIDNKVKEGSVLNKSGMRLFPYTGNAENPGKPTNIYYMPAGFGFAAIKNPNLSTFYTKSNNFWSVTIQGFGQDSECYIQNGQERTIDIPGKLDEWVCISQDRKTTVPGVQQQGGEGKPFMNDYVSFTIKNCQQPYIIHPTKLENPDIDFYAFIDDEPVLLSRSGDIANFGAYNWNDPKKGENYVKGSDLTGIYGKLGVKPFDAETDISVGQPSPFAYAERGGIKLNHGNVIEKPIDGGTQKFSPYTGSETLYTTPGDVYYMPAGLGGNPTGGDIMSRPDVKKNTFYSINVYGKDQSGELRLQKSSYFLYGSKGVVSVEGKESDNWVCIGDYGFSFEGKLDSSRGIVNFEFNEQNLPGDSNTNTPPGVTQSFTIIKSEDIPGMLNVDFYVFADRQRVHIKNADVPVVKKQDGKHTYLYLSAETLEKYYGEFGFKAEEYTPEKLAELNNKIIDTNTIFYSKRDHNLVKSAKPELNPENPGSYMAYVSKTGNPVDVFYVPFGERHTDTWDYNSLMNSGVKGYNGFFRIRVADPDGLVYTPTQLALVPDVNYVRNYGMISVTVSNIPKDEDQFDRNIEWELRDVNNTRKVNLTSITKTVNDVDRTTTFTFDIAKLKELKEPEPPYLIIPAEKPLSRATKETIANFYYLLNGEYVEIANRKIEQVFIPASDLQGNMISDGTVNSSDILDRYYIPAETLEAVYYDCGFRENMLGEGKRILFAHDESGGLSQVYKAPLYKDPVDGKIYVPVLKNGGEVTVYYLANGTYNISNGYPYYESANDIKKEETFFTIRRLDPKHQVYDSGWHMYLPSTIRGKNSTDPALSEFTPISFKLKATDKNGSIVTWESSAGADNVKIAENNDGTCTVTINAVTGKIDIKPAAPVPPGHYRIVYDTIGDLSHAPEDMVELPKINGQTRYIVDIPMNNPGHTVLAPLPNRFIYESPSDKGMIESEFTSWWHKEGIKNYYEKPGMTFGLKCGIEQGKTYYLTAQWKNRNKDLGDSDRVNFFVCTAALPDGSKEPPTTNVEDFTSSVYVSRCNYKTAWNGKTHQQIAGHSGSTNYDDDHKDVMKLLTGKLLNGKLYQIDSFPSDEEVFTDLRRRGTVIKLNGERIPPEMLTTEFFTIRWFSFKDDHDGWHLDGRIMAKTGELVVTKRFTYPENDLDAKNAAEKIKSQGFHIDIKLDPKAGEANKHAVHAFKCLRLPEDATALGTDIKGEWNDDGTICTWHVPIDSFAKYILTEENYIPDRDVCPGITTTPLYNLYNAMYEHENVTTWNPYPNTGIKFTGRGVQPGGGLLTIDLDNNYVTGKQLSITKYDATTGHHMANISFDVYEEGKPELITTLTTDSNGYAYHDVSRAGTFILREHEPTAEGGPALGYLSPGDIKIVIEPKPDDLSHFRIKSVSCEAAETVGNPLYGKRNIVTFTPGTLDIDIRNYSKTMNVKIEKVWENADHAEDVVIQLYRDGAPMAGKEFIHKFRKADFVRDPLRDDTMLDYTFPKPVPVTVDGEPAHYTVVETAIGNTKYSGDYADGYQYYDVHYDPIKYFSQPDFTSPDGAVIDGRDAKSAVITTRNRVARQGRYIMKSAYGTGAPMAGVEFWVYEDSFNGVTPEVVKDNLGYVQIADLKDQPPLVPIKIKTGEDGYLDFTAPPMPDPYDKNGNIVVKSYYMVEHKAPEGFEDNTRLYYFVMEGQNLRLFSEKIAGGTWRPIADRDIVNYPKLPKQNCVDITVVNRFAGNMYNPNAGFEFTIDYKEGSPGQQTSMSHRVNLTKDAEHTIYDVSMESQLVVTELAPGSYQPSVVIEKINPNGTVETVKSGYTAGMENGNFVIRCDIPDRRNIRKGTQFKITVTNTLDAQPDTGIRLDSLPYALILGGAAAAGGIIAVKRRKKRLYDAE